MTSDKVKFVNLLDDFFTSFLQDMYDIYSTTNCNEHNQVGCFET